MSTFHSDVEPCAMGELSRPEGLGFPLDNPSKKMLMDCQLNWEVVPEAGSNIESLTLRKESLEDSADFQRRR